MYLYGVTSHQIVLSFVVVQDGTAIISVVLQINPTVRRAGLCSFSSGPQPSFSSDHESAFTFCSLIEMAERSFSKSPPRRMDAAGGWVDEEGGGRFMALISRLIQSFLHPQNLH